MNAGRAARWLCRTGCHFTRRASQHPCRLCCGYTSHPVKHFQGKKPATTD